MIDSDVLLSRFSRMSLAERKMARSVALTRRGRAGAIAVRGCQVPSGGEAAFTMGSDGAGADVREDDGPGQGGTDRWPWVGVPRRRAPDGAVFLLVLLAAGLWRQRANDSEVCPRQAADAGPLDSPSSQPLDNVSRLGNCFQHG
ncbi:hypothetical protein BCD49_10425 [Pseudofrankia sp. EUN1h]|nr:hypothetical protein BCD49_10425 [Pseudofrankia sp. EUN1h]